MEAADSSEILVTYTELQGVITQNNLNYPQLQFWIIFVSLEIFTCVYDKIITLNISG
jgi:hypothetical protein